MFSLDFSHAYPGRTQKTAVNSAPFAPFVRRLARELPDLPFLTLDFADDLGRRLHKNLEWLRSFNHLLVLGIGGSALGARALQQAFAPGQDRPGYQGPWLWVADNADPEYFEALLAGLPLEDTLVAVISKSGSTVETLAQYLLLLPILQKKLPATWQEHLYIITDAHSGFLREQAARFELSSLPVPQNLGGRYSVLSAVGLAPAAFLGLDWQALLTGAQSLSAPLLANPDQLPEHPAWRLALWAVEQFRSGKSQLLFFSYIPKFAGFNPWFAQLWAESLGKNGQGSMPVPAVGATDQHSLLQMFLDGPRDKACLFLTAPTGQKMTLGPDLPGAWAWLSGRGLGDILTAEALGTRMSLADRGVPLLHLNLPATGEKEAGKLIMLLEAATLFAGWLLEIDPLDQPAVERGKVLAKAELGASGLNGEAAELIAQLAAFKNKPGSIRKF